MTTDRGAATTVRIATNRLPVARRLGALQELFDRSIGMDVEAERDQPVDLHVHAVPGLRRALMLQPFTARAARPSARLSDGDDTVCLMVKSGGRMALRQGRREAVPDVGDGMLLVYRQPSQLRFQDATYLSVRVPLRELAMLCLGEYGLKHGVDIAINWPGRIGVFWIMAGLFFAMVFAGWVPVAFFFFGLAMALIATVHYARTGILAVRAAKAAGTAKRSPRG